MAVDINLRTYLLTKSAVTSITTTIQQNVINQDKDATRVWYQRRSSEEEVDISGNGGIVETTFDIECISTDIDVAQNLSDAVRTSLNGYQGSLGNTYAQAVFCEDHSDEYYPKNQDGDEGYHVAALDVKIIHASA